MDFDRDLNPGTSFSSRKAWVDTEGTTANHQPFPPSDDGGLGDDADRPPLELAGYAMSEGIGAAAVGPFCVHGASPQDAKSAATDGGGDGLRGKVGRWAYVEGTGKAAIKVPAMGSDAVPPPVRWCDCHKPMIVYACVGGGKGKLRRLPGPFCGRCGGRRP